MFALSPGSKIPPAGSKGVSEASTDPQVIRELFDRAGPGAGIGLVPGPDYFVLDIDSHLPRVSEDKRKGRPLCTGLEALAMMEQEIDTLAAETPSGGIHAWYLSPPWIQGPKTHLEIQGYLTGLDIRGISSYVVAPPTRFESGVYRWLNRLKAREAPGWLLDILRPHEPQKSTAAPYKPTGRENRYAERVLESACKALSSGETGHHDRCLAQGRLLGGYIAAGYISRAVVEEALVAAADCGRPKEGRGNRRTISNALDMGEASPCHPPPMERDR